LRPKPASFQEVTPGKGDNVVEMEHSDDEELDLFVTKTNQILESDTSSDSDFLEVIEKPKITKAIKKV
jgi:hypothetical protein